MRAKATTAGTKHRAAAGLPMVEEDVLIQIVTFTPEQSRILAATFRRWADLCERDAILKGNELPAEAAN